MNRPSVLQVGGTLYWVILIRNPDTWVLKDADSTPTVAVRKNGASTADSVTVNKRSATTGIYDCSYNPASEVEGDKFTFEESATVTGTTTSSATYRHNWDLTVIAVERGTDGANTTAPPTSAANATAVRAELAIELARIDVDLSSRLSTTYYDNSLSPNASSIVERSTNDNKAITFSWPVSGATITGQKSIDNGAYSAVAGAITFLRTESNRHYYSLAYNAADRNTVESSIRYKMTDGTYTKYFNLHVVPSGEVNVTVSPLTAEQEPRNTRSRIIVYTGEGGTQYFYAIDSAGNSLNLTGFNLELRFAKGKSVIYTAKTSNGSLTVSNNNQVTFTRSAALTRGDGELTYALRNMGAGEEVLLDGPVTVRYAP